jgi:hypothetical protein
MKASGPRLERETTVRLCEAEDSASICTASQSMYRKFIRLGYALEADEDRSAFFKIPRGLITFRRAPVEGAKRRRGLSPEHKAKLHAGRLRP